MIKYELTIHQRGLLEMAIELTRGQKIKSIRAPMRDCNDVPEYIARMMKAHEETANSRLRFDNYITNN